MRKSTLLLPALILSYFVVIAPAAAYLDPGTMMTFIQLLVGALAGAFVALGLYWYQFKSFVGRLSRRRQDSGFHRQDQEDGTGDG